MKAELEKHCVNRDLDSQLVFERDSWDEFFENHVVKEVFYRFVNRAKNPVPIYDQGSEATHIKIPSGILLLLASYRTQH